MNIKEFCRAFKTYRDYFVKTANLIEEDRKRDCLDDYSKIADRVLKITETDNILTLNRLLFNVLSALDALIGYVYNKANGWASHKELAAMINIIKPLLNAKTIDTNQDFDLMELLHQTRNTLIHNGKFVCKFATVPSGAKDTYIPALIIIPSDIFNEQYCKKHSIAKDYFIDTYEIFNKFLEAFSKININQIL